MTFLTFLFGLLDPIERIGAKIIDARIAATNATTDQAKIAAEERAKALEVRRDVLIAEAGSGMNQIVRAAITGPFIIYFWKLIVWDKIVMGGRTSTDDLGANLWWVATVIIGFYFVSDVTKQVTRYLKR